MAAASTSASLRNSAGVYLQGAAAVAAFACFAWSYQLSFSVRTVGAVIAPVITSDLGLSQADLGLLIGAYFAAFTLMQIPLGILLDRYGVRSVQAVLLLIAAVGTALFAVAENFVLLWLGRALLGLGSAGCLMAAYKLFAERFAPKRLPQLTAWTAVVGSSGALLSTVPASAALPFLGWRGLYGIFAALFVLAAYLCWRFGPPPLSLGHSATQHSEQGWARQYADFKKLVSERSLWPLYAVGMFINGGFIASHTLWAGPWLSTVGGLDAVATATGLLSMSIAMMVGQLGHAFVIGPIERRRIDLRKLLACGLGGCLIAAGWIALGGQAPWPVLPWIMFAMMLGPSNVAFSIVVRTFSPELAGRASTIYNMAIFFGAFVVQWGMGVLLDHAISVGLARSAAFNYAYGWVWVLQFCAFASLLYGIVRTRSA